MKSKITTRLLKVPSAAWVILVMVIACTALSNKYLTLGNIVNIIQQNAVLLIVALGATLILLTEGIDLSLGSIVSLSGIDCVIVMVYMSKLGCSNVVAMIIGVLAGLLTGVLIGALSGGLIAIAKMPPFIATLGTSGIAAALALVFANSSAIYIDNPVFVFFGQKLDRFTHIAIFQYISMPTVIAMIMFVIVWLVLYHTSFGRNLIAIGGNEAGARLSGINTVSTKWLVYAFAGGLAAIGGMVLAARIQAADSSVGLGMEFRAIAAAVIGGTSFTKGKGGIPGTILGVLVIGMTLNGMNVLGITTIWQPVIIGTVIILAIVFEMIYSRWKEANK
jgi:ribose/xylose/arabinose/galactoside ABC-type transport system permease subunit